jgi:signal transduction histidine kinase
MKATPPGGDRSAREWAGCIDQARHDLRNPLGEILGLSELLQEDAQAAGHQQLLPDCETIRKAASELLAQVNHCLTLGVLTENRAVVDELVQLIRTTSDQIVAATGRLSQESVALKSDSSEVNLPRAISNSARQLGQLALGLAESLGEIVPGKPGAHPFD